MGRTVVPVHLYAANQCRLIQIAYKELLLSDLEAKNNDIMGLKNEKTEALQKADFLAEEVAKLKVELEKKEGHESETDQHEWVSQWFLSIHTLLISKRLIQITYKETLLSDLEAKNNDIIELKKNLNEKAEALQKIDFLTEEVTKLKKELEEKEEEHESERDLWDQWVGVSINRVLSPLMFGAGSRQRQTCSLA
jgi:chromosome segregation ATPase